MSSLSINMISWLMRSSAFNSVIQGLSVHADECKQRSTAGFIAVMLDYILLDMTIDNSRSIGTQTGEFIETMCQNQSAVYFYYPLGLCSVSRRN